jgi:hypothetical protein
MMAGVSIDLDGEHRDTLQKIFTHPTRSPRDDFDPDDVSSLPG